MTGKTQNRAPMWKKLMKNVDLDEPTSFLDHVYLGCTQRECKPNEIIIEDFSKMFESQIFAGATEKLPGWEKPHAITVAWSNDMEGHDRKCLERYCELANKEVEQLFKVSSPCSDDHQLKQEEIESVGELWTGLLTNCLKHACTWHESEDQTFYGLSTILQEQSQIWTQACDRRLARLISYIHHTKEFRQYCHVGNTAQHCRLGLFQDSDFAGDLEDSKSTSTRVLCIFGSQTFVTISWMCKKQTLVSHSSTESEVISLDAGWRMDGILAHDLWDMVIEVLRSTNNTARRTFFSKRVSVLHF